MGKLLKFEEVFRLKQKIEKAIKQNGHSIEEVFETRLTATDVDQICLKLIVSGKKGKAFMVYTAPVLEGAPLYDLIEISYSDFFRKYKEYISEHLKKK